MLHLKTLDIPNFVTKSGKAIPILLSYQTFGLALGSAPIVLVNHALTGNSNVCGKDGWWKDLIGKNKCIDTNNFTVLAFNIPGNGYGNDKNILIDNYKDFVANDIANIFLLGLKELHIESLYAIIGGSVGGGIAWEMAALAPKLIRHLVPVATDWKSTDWLIANCYLQDNILNNSSKPIGDARIHAMMCYRTPESFKSKFNRTINENLKIFNIESWLAHHGDKLNERFQLSAYKLINQLLKTIDISRDKSFEEVVSEIDAHIHIVSVDNDLFFTKNENEETFKKLNELGVKSSFHSINSIHGHDAFLIEYDQLSEFLTPIFKNSAIKVA
jgi:homoserine O-acetyltransferase